jgi:hypothetical protein
MLAEGFPRNLRGPNVSPLEAGTGQPAIKTRGPPQGRPAATGAEAGTRKTGRKRGTAKRRKRSAAGRTVGSQNGS